MELLINSLQPWLIERQHSSGQGGYVGGNMFLYFSLEQVKNRDFRGPDVFVVLDTAVKMRKSWVIWEEGKGPDIIIELLSESTQDEDKTRKKRIYQNQVRVPEYYWFDPDNPEDFAGFALRDGEYQAMQPDSQGRLASSRLDGLRLGHWRGSFHGMEFTWLRWYTAAGTLLPTGEEAATARADEASQRADEASQRADEALARTRLLEQKLRALGIDPEDLT